MENHEISVLLKNLENHNEFILYYIVILENKEDKYLKSKIKIKHLHLFDTYAEMESVADQLIPPFVAFVKENNSLGMYNLNQLRSPKMEQQL